MMPDEALLRRVVEGAKPDPWGYQPRVVAVQHIFALGRTSALELCERFNVDPWEEVRYDGRTRKK